MLALARDLYGKDYLNHYKELNASDERGIDTVRDTVKTYSRCRNFGEIPYNLLGLDECDHMTSDAQHSLRRIMEKSSKTCRFILCVNYSGKIIQPLQSRCVPFRFSFLPKEEHNKALVKIAELESIPMSYAGIETIYEVCGGDMRSATLMLQAAASTGKNVDPEVIYMIAGRAQPVDVQKMLATALKGNFTDARNQLREMMQRYGIAGSDLIKQIHTEIFKLPNTEQTKMKLSGLIGETDFRVIEGADDEIQLSVLLAKLAEGIK